MNGEEAVKEVPLFHQKEGRRMITLPCHHHHHQDPNIGHRGVVVGHHKCVKEMAVTGMIKVWQNQDITDQEAQKAQITLKTGIAMLLCLK